MDSDGGSEVEGALVAEARSPDLAADLDLAGGVEWCAGKGDGSDHGLGPGEDFGAAGFEGDPCEAEGDGAEAEAGGDGGGGVDAEFGDGGVDQCHEAEDETDDAGEAECSVAGEFGFENDEDQSGEQECDGGVADRKEIETEEGEENEERAERAGDYGSGDVELDRKSVV